jgi:hypothetical protein
VAEPRRLLELQRALQDIQAGIAPSEPAAEGRRLFRFAHFSILMMTRAAAGPPSQGTGPQGP